MLSPRRATGIAFVLFSLMFAPTLLGQSDATPMDVGLIVRLVHAGMPSNLIVEMIEKHTDETNFDFTEENLNDLKNAKVSEDVLNAMLSAKFNGYADYVHKMVQPSAAPPEAPAVAPRSAPSTPTPAAPRTNRSETQDSGVEREVKSQADVSPAPTPGIIVSASQVIDVLAIDAAGPAPARGGPKKIDVPLGPQTSANSKIDCTDVKDLPSLLGTVQDGQDSLSGCADVTDGHQKYDSVRVNISKAGQALKCSDTNPSGLSKQLTVALGPADPGGKSLSFSIPGTFKLNLESGQQICLVEYYVDQGKTFGKPSSSPVIVSSIADFKAPPFGFIVGVDVTGASATSPKAVFLGLTTFDFPLRKMSAFEKVPDFESLWVSGKLGITGMAQPGNLTGAATSGFYASAINADPDKIVQSVDGTLRFGWQLHRWPMSLGFFDAPDSQTAGKTNIKEPIDPCKISATDCHGVATFSFIFGGGAITPLSATQSNPQVYEATPLILQTQTPIAPFTSFAPACGGAPAQPPTGTTLPPTPSPTCYVTFIPTDRTRFYRYYDAGFRVKLYPLDAKEGHLRFPAMFDLTIGQNEYVTGGKLQGTVLHSMTTLPFPRLDGVYIFASMDMAISKAYGQGPQLQLIPAPVTTGLTASSPSVYTIPTTQPNRDRYSLGFGLDVFHVFQKYFDAHPNNTTNSNGN